MDAWSSQRTILGELLDQGLLPSAGHLSIDACRLLQSIINIHDVFNLGQFLQAESIPHHIERLKECIDEEGEEPLRCYIVAAAAMMCGLRGTQSLKGSLFMDNLQGQRVLLGVKCLQQVGNAESPAIYWHYVAIRARILELPLNTPDGYALARVACLTRVSHDTVMPVLEAWDLLSTAERDLLVAAFLADGIRTNAKVFQFLPLYLANAIANSAVGLSNALEVLLGLVELLQQRDKWGCALSCFFVVPPWLYQFPC